VNESMCVRERERESVRVYMCVYAYVCACACVCVYIYVYACVFVCESVFACMTRLIGKHVRAYTDFGAEWCVCACV